MQTVGLVAAIIALALTPVYLAIFVKGVRSLNDIRDMFRRPPGDYGNQTLDRGKRGRLDRKDR